MHDLLFWCLPLPAGCCASCRLNIQLADADTSQQPAALQLLPALASLAVTFPKVTHLSFSQYVEPTSVSNVGSSAPKPAQEVQLHVRRSIAGAMHGMLQHAVQQQEQLQQTAAEARGKLHVAVDPAQFVLHAILQEQQLVVGQDLQQQFDELQQLGQQLGQQVAPIIGSGDTAPSQSSGSSSSSSSSSTGCVLWEQLSEVDECPADPLVLAFLLAVSRGIQTLRFRSQQCKYYEVEAEQAAAAAEPSSCSCRSESGVSAAAPAAASPEVTQDRPGSSSGSNSSGSGEVQSTAQTNSSSSSSSSSSTAAIEAVDEQQNNSADASSSSSGSTSTGSCSHSLNSQQQLQPPQQQQQSSNLWFDLSADANLQQQLQLLDSTTPSSGRGNSSSSMQGCSSSPVQPTAAVYSPWCLLQCVQLLQRYAPRVCVHMCRRLSVCSHKMTRVCCKDAVELHFHGYSMMPVTADSQFAYWYVFQARCCVTNLQVTHLQLALEDMLPGLDADGDHNSTV
jgi:hypothetical protein